MSTACFFFGFHITLILWCKSELLPQCSSDSRKNWIETEVSLDSIKEDLTASYFLLDDLQWHDTFYQHISYRFINNNNSHKIIIPKLNSEINSPLTFDNIELNELDAFYKNIYLNRDDINIILHVHNPCISSISLHTNGFIPVDQQYYVSYPFAYNINDIINKRLYTKYKYPSYVLLLSNANGILVFGKTMHDTFTRLFMTMTGAQGQCMALSIMNKTDVILPSIQIQTDTIYGRYNVGPIHDFINGIPEFNSFKRKYGYDHIFQKTLNVDCYANNYDGKSDTASNIQLRKDLAKLYQLLDRFSWTENIYQHITAKIDLNINMSEESNDNYTHRILINPFGVEFGEIEYDTFVELLISVHNETQETKYKIVNGGNSQFAGNLQQSCLQLHSTIYSYRSDAKVAIHVHHPVLSAIGVYKYGLLPLNKLYYDIIKPIRYHSFGSLGHNQNKSSMMIDFGYNSDILILRNHGIIVTGKDVSDAFNKLYYTVQLAKLQVNVMQMQLLTDEMLSDLLDYIERDHNNVVIEKDSYLNVWPRFTD